MKAFRLQFARDIDVESKAPQLSLFSKHTYDS